MSKITSNSTHSKSNGIFNFRFLLKIHFKANAVVPLHQSSSPALLAAFQMDFIKSIEFITLLSNAILSVECVPNSNPPAHIPFNEKVIFESISIETASKYAPDRYSIEFYEYLFISVVVLKMSP